MISTLAVLAPILIYNNTATRYYQATTTIIYEQPKPPLSTEQRPYRYQPLKETVLNQIQEIKSRSVALEVVKALPDWAKQQLLLPTDPAPNFDAHAYYAAIINSNVEAVPVAESDVIEIRVKAANDPHVAMVLANTMCDVLRDRNLRIRREGVSDMRIFIEEQLLAYKDKLDAAESALRTYKVDNRVTSLDKEVEEQLQLAKKIELMYQEAKNERERSEQLLNSVNSQIYQQQKNLAPSLTNVSNQMIQQFKKQLTTLQDDYIKLQLQGVPEDNPKMAEIKNDMVQVRQNLAEEARKIAEQENLIDPVSQISSLYQRRVELELKLQMLRTQEHSLAASLNDYEESLRRLPNKEFELARLTRERDLAYNLYSMLSERREEARINEAEKIGDMRIIDRAQFPQKPVLPRVELNLAIGLMLGLTIGFGLAFFLESLDTSLKTPEDVEKKTGLSILGSIPRFRNLNMAEGTEPQANASPEGLVTFRVPSSPASEAYRTLRTNLQFSNLSQKFRSMMLTSSGPREGKSTTSANLAVVTAQMGLRTLLIDADLRRPTVHRIFNLNREPGLSDILFHYDENGQPPAQDVIEDEDLDIENAYTDHQTSLRAKKALQQMVALDLAIKAAVHKTKIDGLDILTCGMLPPNPSEILAGETMKDLLALLREKYEFVVIDAPPVIAVTDAAVLAPHVDGALLVIESARNDREIILKAKSLLDHVNVNLIGAVLNNVREKNLYGGYDYYYTYYSSESNTRKRRG
ncbi:polysaccharide biosynthesis tyrosine autokinase [candidate division KSB1 bacterium]|nr:polysaccharide biosynthesis tyrosine autokinase [candidate division KSB1 bacterium]RQW04153.1 MAG: polysaccharide biosynthesis tyrosine autokinase [candidate division KSB1 bacterium]